MLINKILLSLAIQNNDIIVKSSYYTFELKTICKINSHRYFIFSGLIKKYSCKLRILFMVTPLINIGVFSKHLFICFFGYYPKTYVKILILYYITNSTLWLYFFYNYQKISLYCQIHLTLTTEFLHFS